MDRLVAGMKRKVLIPPRDLFGNPYEIVDPVTIPATEIHDPDKLVREPRVTVLMTAYNHERYVREAIESILAQQCDFPYEILIGEDVSTDATGAICREMQQLHPDRIRLVVSDHNVGAMGNNSRLYLRIRGKYLAICEGDDCWTDPRKLQKQVDYLEAHPDCGLVCTDFDRYYERDGVREPSYLANKKWAQQVVDDPRRQAGLVLAHWFYARTCTVCYRTAWVLEAWASDPVLVYSTRFRLGDVSTTFLLALKGKVHFMPESTALYRELRESAGNSTDRARALRFFYSCLDLLIYLAEKYRPDLAPVRPLLQRHAGWAVRRMIAGEESPRRTGTILRHCFRLHPGPAVGLRVLVWLAWRILPFLRPLIRRAYGQRIQEV